MKRKSEKHTLGLHKSVGKYDDVFLRKGWTLGEGKGWYSQVWIGFAVGFGFHKTNKFTAVRNAIKDIK